ncbi:putative mitochondrial protein [Lyophyllum shimeji]|uniref:Mitochondrial protein n=1 Tax=Lyophyllum shimeji TaxID=47721 RepID=A0A9P3UMU3_LYOSH|nr:putative mitochondrial protein [Lyophyllum shimeji]
MSPAPVPLPTDASHPSIPLIRLSVPWGNNTKLDRTTGDFNDWSDDLSDALTVNGLRVGFILLAISKTERDGIPKDKGAKALYDALKKRATGEGPVKQVTLLRQALSTYCSVTEPLPTTAMKIREICRRAFAMGPITEEVFTCISLLNSLQDEAFRSIRSTVSRGLSESTDADPYTYDKIRRLLETEQTLLTSMSQFPITDAALAAKTTAQKPKNRVYICDNCKGLGLPYDGHTKPWCTQKGGGCEGKTPTEAKAARIAHYSGLRGKSKATTSTTPSPGKNVVPVKDAAGQVYFADPEALTKLMGGTAVKPEFAGLASAPLPTTGGASIQEIDKAEWETAWLSIEEEPHASVDWNAYSRLVNEDTLSNISPLNQSQRTLLASIADSPFFADTGASSHITHEKSDFIDLVPIAPRPVKGVGGSAVCAFGIGRIRLHVAKGITLTLERALYIPGCTVRLISISSLTRDSNAAAYFDHESVKITDRSTGAFIAGGRLLPDSRLYAINIHAASAEHALSARHSPDLGTWHRRLGHANYQAISEMAKAGLIGDQETSTEDLTGPSPVQSRHGNLYVMNMVDDFTSKPWSIPLRRKSDALEELKAWELAREVETGLKVGVYRTGYDGELTSRQMEQWLKLRGTEQEHGAPYTSAHIGRVEHLHRTLMAKARTMRIAAGCPPNLWDEFYLTASYLHERTLTKSLNGVTPYEMWYERKPDYSHLREIGCRAFILIQNRHNPKIFERSIECVLIGYGLKSKTYRCYDRKSGNVYNSTPKEEQETLDKIPYRSLVGCLLYLAISTRPDISFAVQQLSQYVDSFTSTHWNAAIRLVRYLKGTRDLKLHLGGKGQIALSGFTDSDWASCLDTRRSIGGYTWNLGSGTVSWAARKQKTVAASSCEAEYMAAFEAAQECIWLRALLKGIDHDTSHSPTTILCDNNSAINLSEDPLLHSRVKHVDIKYHFLRERVQSGEIAIKYVNTKQNTADIFTKALPRELFLRFRNMLGLR